MANQFQSILPTLIGKARARRQLIDTLFSLVGINIFLAGLSFVTTLVIANILGKERFGDLSYAIAVGGYCLTIACCGLERTLTFDLVHFPKRFDKYASASILLRGSMLALALVGIIGVNTLVAEENQLGGAGLLIVLAAGVKALYLAPIYDAWDKMKRHAVYLLAERCLYFACIWTLVFFFRDTLSIAAISIFMIGSTALGFTLQYRWALPRLNVRNGRKAMSLAASMLKKNLWVWSAVLATLSIGGLSKILTKHISGSGELGCYAVAWQVITLGSILTRQVTRVGIPRIARIVQPDVSQARRTRFLLQYIGLATTAAALVGVPAICFPATILRIFLPEYILAQSSVRIFGVYVIIAAIGLVADQYLIAVHKRRAYSLILILTGGLSLVLFSFLIPRWAGTGAALAVLLSRGIAILISLIIVLRHYRLLRRHCTGRTP